MKDITEILEGLLDDDFDVDTGDVADPILTAIWLARNELLRGKRYDINSDVFEYAWGLRDNKQSMTSLGFKKLPITKIGSVMPCIVFYEDELKWADTTSNIWYNIELCLGPKYGFKGPHCRFDAISIMKSVVPRDNKIEYYLGPSQPIQRVTKGVKRPRIWEMPEEYAQKIVARLK